MRRFRNPSGYNFWPSFVDALSTLLIVVLFFLLLFVLAHFFMGRNLDTKNTEISLLNSQLQNLASELSAERKTSRDLTLETQKLSAELDGVKDEQTKALAQIALLEQDVKALTLRRQELEKETAAKSKELKTERKISQEAKAHLALLNAQTEKMTKELSRLGNLLDQADKKDKEQKAQIADLGKKLNRALAAKASELASYRSEFFGTLRKVLQDRDDFRIEGDRFVFQSELFFKSGSAFLEDKGKKQLNVLAKTIKELQRKIPAKISWVLRVDGHTDNIPIHNELYSSNWQLSANRAIAVVQYLIDQGVPARYLVAAGFGEHQPIDRRNTEAARRKNRRIEFKLTER
ncbi:MAG: peptidoglycan -binding protein [Alphaproteobacteria bacterium]|nr:peptidoglycan -binding protein [Alphaproteobacteria bacterium]